MRSSSRRWLDRPELDAGQEVDRMGVQPVRGVERLVRLRVSGARANHLCGRANGESSRRAESRAAPRARGCAEVRYSMWEGGVRGPASRDCVGRSRVACETQQSIYLSTQRHTRRDGTHEACPARSSPAGRVHERIARPKARLVFERSAEVCPGINFKQSECGHSRFRGGRDDPRGESM